MPLTDEDIRQIVARAEQLQRASDPSGDDMEALVRAGGELGISKAAMQRAFHERLGAPVSAAAGELVFARSSDDKYYAAEVVAVADGEYRVRYLRGGERTVGRHEIRPSSFLPGERIICPWPGWGAWTCTVLSYDPANACITVTDGWAETATFPIRDVWLAPPSAERQRRIRIYAAVFGAGAAVGAVASAIVSMLIL